MSELKGFFLLLLAYWQIYYQLICIFLKCCFVKTQIIYWTKRKPSPKNRSLNRIVGKVNCCITSRYQPLCSRKPKWTHWKQLCHRQAKTSVTCHCVQCIGRCANGEQMCFSKLLARAGETWHTYVAVLSKSSMCDSNALLILYFLPRHLFLFFSPGVFFLYFQTTTTERQFLQHIHCDFQRETRKRNVFTSAKDYRIPKGKNGIAVEANKNKQVCGSKGCEYNYTLSGIKQSLFKSFKKTPWFKAWYTIHQLKPLCKSVITTVLLSALCSSFNGCR